MAESTGRGSSGSSSWPPMQKPILASNPSKNDGSVPAIMNYVSQQTKEISTRRDIGGSDSTLVGAIWEPTQIQVANARLLLNDDNKRMTLDRNGFELWSNNYDESIEQMDFCNQDQVVDEYYPLCERLVSDAIKSQQSVSSSSATSIAAVYAFDHNVRSSDIVSVGKIKSKRALLSDDGDEDKAAPQVQNPAGLVHADYTKTSAPRRLNDLSKTPKFNDVLRPKLIAENRKSLIDPTICKEALAGKRRYAFINVWRSIDPNNTVQNPPLACVDATCTTIDDLRMFKIHYVDRVGENYFVCPPVTSNSNDRQQHGWYYYPDMTIKEALLLKQWDSKGRVACGAHSDGIINDTAGSKSEGSGAENGCSSTFTIHSAFLDSTAPDKPPRKSIEVRCIVIWDGEKE